MSVPDAPRIVPVVSDDDLGTWVALHNAAVPNRPWGPLSLRHLFESAPDWEAVLALRGPRPAGAGHVEVEHWSPGSRHAESWIAVPPGDRGRGVGGALYRHASGWARSRGLAGLDVWIDEADPDAARFWERRGFHEVGRERMSRLRVAGPAEPSGGEPPEGIVLVTLAGRPELEAGMYAVALEATADVPGAEPYAAGDFAHWRRGELRVPGLVEDCTIVALAGERVVGYATLLRREAEPEVAEHWMTAVARDHRGRGLATAMKREQIRRAPAAGLTELEAANEERNAPMRAVNARLGYRPRPAMVNLRGPLAA